MAADIINATLTSLDAIFPKKMTKYSCGFDLSTIEETIIPPLSTKIIQTGLAIELPLDVCALVLGRSSLAKNLKLIVHTGLIDIDFREQISVVVHSLNSETVVLSKNSRFAQLLLLKMCTYGLKQVSTIPPPNSARKGGFGSTDSQCSNRILLYYIHLYT